MTEEGTVIDEVASSVCEIMTEEGTVIDEVASSACESMICSVNMYIITNIHGILNVHRKLLILHDENRRGHSFLSGKFGTRDEDRADCL